MNTSTISSVPFKIKNHRSTVNIGLIGLGTVGQAFYDQVKDRKDIHIKEIVVQSEHKERTVDQGKLSYNIDSILSNENIDIVVELIDDANAAYEYAKAALKKGKSLISANKKMLAHHIIELEKLSDKYGGQIFFEAAVGGAIPILRVLRTVYDTEQIDKIEGIINGSTNYILTKMTEDNISFTEALKDAQDRGYAESDPTLDVEGYDAAYKSVLLAYKGIGIYIHPSEIDRKGISQITLQDIKKAERNKERIKLISTISKEEDQLRITVAPQHLDSNHDLYHIRNERNAINIQAPHSGNISLSGQGAGGEPTASAVVADLNNAISKRNVEKSRQLS